MFELDTHSADRISIYETPRRSALQVALKRAGVAMLCGLVAAVLIVALSAYAGAPAPAEQLAVSGTAVDSAINCCGGKSV